MRHAKYIRNRKESFKEFDFDNVKGYSLVKYYDGIILFEIDKNDQIEVGENTWDDLVYQNNIKDKEIVSLIRDVDYKRKKDAV